MSIPRSPFEAAEGLIWLPRLLDKARKVGLGDYLLFEDSPLDARFMRSWRVTGDELRGWLAAGLDDGAIALKIGEKRGWDQAGREAWSRKATRVWGPFFAALDADEGRLPPGARATALKAMLAVTFAAVSIIVAAKGRKHR